MLKHFDRERLIWSAALPSNEKLILLALNTFVDGNGECWPGQALLASMTGLTDRTVRNLCKSLESRRIIQRSKRRKDGHQTSDIYFVHFTVLSEYLQPENISASQPENDGTWRKEIPPASRKMTTFQPETVSDDLSSELPNIDQSRSLEAASEKNPQVGDELPDHAVHSPSQVSRIEPKPQVGIDSLKWQMTFNQHKPDKWPTVRYMNSQAYQDAARRLIEVAGNEGEALKMLETGLRHINTCDDKFWREFKGGSFSYILAKDKIHHLLRWVEEAQEHQAVAAKPSPQGHEAVLAKIKTILDENRWAYSLPDSFLDRPGFPQFYHELSEPDALEYLALLSSYVGVPA